jgi:hypothetical protein
VPSASILHSNDGDGIDIAVCDGRIAAVRVSRP